MDTDLLPNSASSYFAPTIPDETAKLKEEEMDKAVEAFSYIDKLIEWFESCIASTDSIAAAKEEAKRLDKSFEATSDAYEIVRILLEQKKNELRSLASTIKR